jgi:hypothetical protein
MTALSGLQNAHLFVLRELCSHAIESLGNVVQGLELAIFIALFCRHCFEWIPLAIRFTLLEYHIALFAVTETGQC